MKRILFTLIISFIAVFQTGCDEIVENFSGCMLEDAPNYDSTKIIPCETDCIGDQTGANCCCEEIIYGCMDESAPNFSTTANAPCVEKVSGVETPNACCTDSIMGCMDKGASTFNPLATVAVSDSCFYESVDVTLEDGSTISVTYGCMNGEACNVVDTATADCNQENEQIAGTDWVQNDDCCDLSANSVCYLDLNNNGYWEEADSTSASLPTCNCGELGVGWVTGDDVATNMEVQGCTQPTVDGVACIEYNPVANVDNGGCCLTELTDEELANPEIALVGVYNMEITMGMLDDNGDCEAFEEDMYGDFGPTINQVTLGAGGGFNHHEEYHDSFNSRPEWEFRAPGIDSDVACEEKADELDADYWFCRNWGVGDDFSTCDDFYDQQGCMSGPGCRWETNFCHPTFSGMPCNDINFAPDFANDPEGNCDMRDDCEWDEDGNGGNGACFTPVWEPWMECMYLDDYECESYGDFDEDGVFEQHCEVPAFDPSELDCLDDCECMLDVPEDGEASEDDMCTFVDCMVDNDCWSDCDYVLQDEFEIFGWISYICEAPESCGDMFMDDDDGEEGDADEDDEGPPECMEDCNMGNEDEENMEMFCESLPDLDDTCIEDCDEDTKDKLECLDYICAGCATFDCSDMDRMGDNSDQNKEELFYIIKKIIRKSQNQNKVARGGQCEEGEIEDCNGDCIYEDWVGDDWCDDSLNCSDFDYDGGDCEGENDEWDEDDISCMPNLETYPCFGYDETECMSMGADCNWHAGDGMDEPGFCSPPIGNSIGVCQEITDEADCNAKVGECHWLEHGPNPEDPPFCAPAPPDCFNKNNEYDCEDSPNCEWDMPDWIDPWADGVCFKDDHCKSNPELNNNEDACNDDPGCEWVWDGADSGCWEIIENEAGSFCECMLPFTRISCEAAGGSWELPPWVMEGDEWAEKECMMPMSEQDCFHEFENDDPCADDHSGGNEQTSWDADTHTCTKSFGFSEAGEWSINADGEFCLEWDNEEDEDPDCNTLMTPDKCNCFDCMWNGSTGICADWDDGGNGRVSDHFYTQRYENIIEILSNNNAGECFEFDMVEDEIHMTIIHGYGYCEEIVMKPVSSTSGS